MEVKRVDKGSTLEASLIKYAQNCSWIAGGHLAMLLSENKMTDWETAFALLDGQEICGFCTLLKTDYYPENRYFPWISTVFVDEEKRGARLSDKMIDAAALYAKELGFSKVYIPSDMTGFYEKYGFEKIDELMNYAGDMDQIFVRKL